MLREGNSPINLNIRDFSGKFLIHYKTDKFNKIFIFIMTIAQIQKRNLEVSLPLSNLKSAEEKYIPISVIGQGTYGKVYKVCKRKNQQRFFAIKKISRIKEGLEGFPYTSIREIKLLNSIRHENVVRIHEIFTSRGTERKKRVPSTFIVMEYVDFDLWQIWRNHSLSIP